MYFAQEATYPSRASSLGCVY